MVSSIPDALAALVALWQSTPALSGVIVSDGPFNGAAPAQMVTVGYNGEDDQAVTGTTTPEGWDPDTNLETYTILCSAAAVIGDDNQSAARTAAFDLHAACCDALQADSTLGDTVMQALPGDFTVRQQAGDRGRACLVLFGVNVRANTI